MSLLSHLGDIEAIAHAVDAIHNADAQLHAAHKGDTVTLAVPGAGALHLKTASGRRLHIAGVAVVMDDDPKPHPGHPAGGGSP